MEFNKPLTSDYPLDSTPNGSIVFARNRLLTNGYKSSENEDGFTHQYDIEGNVVGSCYTKKGIITISTRTIINDDTNRTITYFIISKNGVVILCTQYIEWNPILATEIVYQINAVNELIIAFWNGVDTFSNRPRLINIDNLPFTLNNNLEIIAETTPNIVSAQECADRSLMFATIKQSVFETWFDTTEHGNIIQGRYSVCIKYVTDNGLTQSTIPTVLVDAIITKMDTDDYHTFEQRNQTQALSAGVGREMFGRWNMGYSPNQPNDSIDGCIKIYIGNMDLKYTLFNLYIIKVTDDGKISVDEITNLTVSTNFNYTYNGKASNYNVGSEGILTEYLTFDKIQTGVVLRNALYLYNTKKNSEISYQPYANNIKVGWDFKRNKDGTLVTVNKWNKGAQVCMPNEVYSFNIHLIKLDGTIGVGYHIPGRSAIGTELNNIPNDARYVGTKGDYTNLKEFHLNPNKEITAYNGNKTLVSNNANGIGCGRLSYWENENEYYLYDDINNYEVRDVDSNGDSNPILPALTSTTNVRHHRMPNIETIYSAVPYKVNGDTSSTTNMEEPYPYIIEPVFYDIKFPKEILQQISGYVISYIRKDMDNNVVSAVAPLLRFYPVNITNSNNQPVDVSSSGNKTILFDFTLQNKKPQINTNIIRIEHQVSSGKDAGGYGAWCQSNYDYGNNQGTLNAIDIPSLPIPHTNGVSFPHTKLGSINNTNKQQMQFGINFASDSVGTTGFANTGTRNVKFLSVSNFEYLQYNNITQNNQSRAECIKLEINNSSYLFPDTNNANSRWLNLNNTSTLTFPCSNIYYYNGNPSNDTYNSGIQYSWCGSYPFHILYANRRIWKTQTINGWMETNNNTNNGDYYALYSGHQFDRQDDDTEVKGFNNYTLCQRYYLVSILNNVKTVHLDYKNQDCVLLHNVRLVEANTYNYNTYNIVNVDSNDMYITNQMVGDCYYNLYTMLFTDYNYDVQKQHDSSNVGTYYNTYCIPIRIPSYSRMNPNYRYSEKATKPLNWIRNILNYNKDGYDLSFLKLSNFRTNSIFNDKLFNITHYFNYIFKSAVSTGESTEIGWRKFMFVDTDNKPNFKIVPNTKGQGIALNATDDTLYIQAEDTLCILQYKDKLTTEVVLQERDILEAPIKEFFSNDNMGKIGAMFRRCAELIPIGYIVIDFKAKIVHLITDKYSNTGLQYKYYNELYKRLSDISNSNTNIELDNINKICTIGYDPKYNRLLISLKYQIFVPITYTEDFDINIITTFINKVYEEIEHISFTTDDGILIDTTTSNTATITLANVRFVYNDIYTIFPIEQLNTSNSVTTTVDISDTSNTVIVDNNTNLITYTTTRIKLWNEISIYETHDFTKIRNLETLLSTNIALQISNIIATSGGIIGASTLFMYLENIINNNIVGIISLNTLNVTKIYVGYRADALFNTDEEVDFLAAYTPFYPITASVTHHSKTYLTDDYTFYEVINLNYITYPIGINTLTGSNITFTQDSGLTAILGTTYTQLNSTFFIALFNMSKTLGNPLLLSQELIAGSVDGGILCGIITASNDVLINLLDTSWTTLNYTFKYSIDVLGNGYMEDIYFDMQFTVVDSTVEFMIKDIYTMRMKYLAYTTTSDWTVNEMFIEQDDTITYTTVDEYQLTEVNTDTQAYSIITNTITSTINLYQRVLYFLTLYNYNVNILNDISIGTITSDSTLPNIYINVSFLDITIEFRLLEDNIYEIFIIDINKRQESIAIDKYDTYSFMDELGYISKHDYTGNFFLNDREYFINIFENKLYKQNGKKLEMLPYHNISLTDRPNWVYTLKPFYVDILINFGTSYIVDSVIWIANLINQNANSQDIEQTKSISAIMIYTDTQCSDIIELSASASTWFDQTLPRFINGEFRFNNFRDEVVITNKAILDDDGVVFNSSYVNTVAPFVVDKNIKKWFDNSLIISKFAVVRFILDPTNNYFYNRTLQLNDVKIMAKTDNR